MVLQTNFHAKKNRPFKLFFAVLFTMLLISGCSIGVEPNSLMKPPRPIGDIGDIQAKIEHKYGNDVLFKYPKAGDHRSSIILHDINSDGKDEAIALYHINSSDESIHLTIFEKDFESWSESADFLTYENNIDQICFGDIDSDKCDEIIIGWSSYNLSNNRFKVFDYFNGTFREIDSDDEYSDFLVADLNDDDTSEIISVCCGKDNEKPCLKLIRLNPEDDFETTNIANINANMTNINLSFGLIDRNHKGIIVEGIVTENNIYTDMFYWDILNQSLISPLYDDTSKFSSTAREFKVFSQDINDDQIIEMPLFSPVNTNRKSKYPIVPQKIDWVQYDTKAQSFKKVKSVLYNGDENYTIKFLEKWQQDALTKIFVTIDSDSRSLTCSESVVDKNGLTAAGVDLFTIEAFPESNTSNKSKNIKIICEEHGTVYAITKINPNSELSITEEEIIKSFEKLKNT